MRKPAASPVSLEANIRMSLVPSKKAVATTPAPAALILVAISATVSVANTVTSTGPVVAGVKLAPPPLQVPSCKVSVPEPTACPAVSGADDTDCVCASTSTSSVNEVAAVVDVALMVAAAVFDELAVRALQAPAAEMRWATSDKAENSDWICANADTCAW